MEEIDGSLFIYIFDLVGTIVGLLAAENEVKTIFSIGSASKTHYEYIHSKRLWQHFYDRINDEIPLLPVKSDLHSDDRAKQFQAAEHLRKLLVVYSDPQESPDLLPRLVQILDTANDMPTLQYEVIWILTNIAAGTERHTQSVIDAGAITPLLRLFKSDNLDLQEQCALALSNIIADNLELTASMLAEGVVPVIVTVLEGYKKIEAVRSCTMFYENMCRNKPVDHFDLLFPAIPSLIELLMRDERDQVTCLYASWALAWLLDINNDTIFQLLQNRTNAIQTLIELMPTQIPVLKVLGTIIYGSSEQIRAVVSAGFMKQARTMITATNPVSQLDDLFWALSNVMTDQSIISQLLIEDGDIFPHIIAHANNPASTALVKKEVMWTIANVMEDRRESTHKYFLHIGVLKPIYNALSESEADLVTALLKVLKELLALDKREDLNVQAQLRDWGAKNLLESLSDEDYVASEILSDYFED